MPTTEQNLKEAFAGESQANRRYLAFARKAESEGLPGIAKLFRTVAEAETIHAHAHLNALEAVGSTAENLRHALEGELFEAEKMYPPMIEQAESEGHRGRRMFGYAAKVEAVHAKLYEMALKAAEQSKDLTGVAFHLCPVCGYVEMGEPTADCPVCGAKKEKLIQI